MSEKISEIPLNGGRMTASVTRKGEIVYRSCCVNTPLARSVLLWLEEKGLSLAPRHLGFAPDGREMISYLEGVSPTDLGEFSDEQLRAAAKLIRVVHDALKSFPGCKPNQTICHNDLSPCNFMFKDEMPYAIFDWDALSFGDSLDDLAYVVWMWCDLGDSLTTQDQRKVAMKMETILEAYGLARNEWLKLATYIVRQMQRVAMSLKEAGKYEASEWAEQCLRTWLIHKKEIMKILLK